MFWLFQVWSVYCFYVASKFILGILKFCWGAQKILRGRYQSLVPLGEKGKIKAERQLTPPFGRDLVSSIFDKNNSESTATKIVKKFIDSLDSVRITNCVVESSVLFEQAQRRANILDQQLEKQSIRREDVPLFGLPVSIKECFMVEGTDSTHGLKRYVNKPAKACEEAVLVKMLRHLGALPYCKTNVPQIMYSWECSNPVYGTTTHPLHLDYIPGGSSGGEACLIAQGGSIIGLGSDIGGSCRIPAHMSGCVGLKPTKNRLSSRGKGRDVTYGTGQPAVASCSGLLGRSVDDIVFLMENLCSPAALEYGRAHDNSLLPIPWQPEVIRDTRPLRIAYYDYDGYLEASPACRRAVQEAAKVLKDAGHELVPFTPPNVRDGLGIFFALLSSGAEHIASELQGEQIAEALKKLMLNTLTSDSVTNLAGWLKAKEAPIFAHFVKHLSSKNVTQYYEWVQKKENWISQFNAQLDNLNTRDGRPIDIILAPVHPLPTHRHGDADGLSPACCYCAIYNLLDYACGVVPWTTVKPSIDAEWPITDNIDSQIEIPIRKMYTQLMEEGVPFPVGVQICARSFRSELVLRAMGEIEKLRGPL